MRYQSSKDEGWEQALQDAGDVVAVAGGDGTVSRVAKRLVGRGIPLAPLPMGTANNISRTLGLAGLPIEEIVRSWENPRRVKLDVGVVEAGLQRLDDRLDDRVLGEQVRLAGLRPNRGEVNDSRRTCSATTSGSPWAQLSPSPPPSATRNRVPHPPRATS